MDVTPSPAAVSAGVADSGEETLTGSLGSPSGDLRLTNEEDLLADSHSSVDDKVVEDITVIPISQVYLKIKERATALAINVPLERSTLKSIDAALVSLNRLGLFPQCLWCPVLHCQDN